MGAAIARKLSGPNKEILIHYNKSKLKSEKLKKISTFLSDFQNNEELLEYFDHFNTNLSKKTLNSYLKSVRNQ